MNTISEFFSLEHTIAREIFNGVDYPHKILDLLGGFILNLGETLSKDDFYCYKSGVWVSKSARIADSAYICAPCIIDADAEIRHSAYIRGNAIIGKRCVVGNSTELKNVLLFDGVQVPHYNYVGDSVLGYKSHLGAGAITSNVKMDRSHITVCYGKEKVDTGMKKIGAIIGDFVEVGCGAVLNPGTVIGKNSNIYPLSSVRGYVCANSIYKSSLVTERKLPYRSGGEG